MHRDFILLKKKKLYPSACSLTSSKLVTVSIGIFSSSSIACFMVFSTSSIRYWKASGTYNQAHIVVMPRLPHSLEKVVPILVLQFENDPLFATKHWLSSSKRPLFRDKTLTFQFKTNPFFWGKILTIQHKWTPFSMVKDWTAKLNLFLQIHKGEHQNTPFSRKMQILDFLKKYPFIREL